MSVYSKSLTLIVVLLMSLTAPFVTINSQAQTVSEIEVLHTAVNPSNNKTYHLLSPGSWTDSAVVARALDGFLTTIDDQAENQWVFDTFASYDNQSRHLWIGLSDENGEDDYRWHDGTPFHYRNWGDGQPSDSETENFVHIAGTNMGNIMPGTWNDLSDDPQYFPVYGVVEVGDAVDYALRFDGQDDHVIIEDEIPEFLDSITITALVNTPDTDGIQFITMLGDYGWGLYINDGELGYSSQYSISQHPNSNTTIQEDVWTEVTVTIEEDVGGEFFIDGNPAGEISPEDAQIPQGDFGSNDCYQSGEDCDELYFGQMGAGCDCNYFHGMIDYITVSNEDNAITWEFLEGEGSFTEDSTQEFAGDIDGASWVMPDGTIVAQAIQLFSDEEVYEISGQEGDQLLFFMEIEEYTRNLYLDAYFAYDDWEDWGQYNFDAYFAHDYIPNPWEYDDIREDNYDYMWVDYSWPDEGILWMVIVPKTDIDDLTIYAYAEIADPPPSLDEMTELVNEIPVTSQKINPGRGASDEDRVLHYYVNVTENLSSLTVETYGGTGNVDLAISSITVPDPFNSFFGWEEPWFEEFDDVGVIGGYVDVDAKSDWSTGPGNEQQVSLYDLSPGIYYVTAYTYGKANDFTIVASMAFQPDNIEPEDAIELIPGVAYGPISGYDGLSQYFKINVPESVERLEIDLNDGFGEASIFVELGDSPSTADYTYRSNSPGAGDKIGFNDPTPGTYYILVHTEMVFGEVTITASFTDRYVWNYDGTPIQLFNGEEVSGIEAPAGESLSFFVQLDSPGEYLTIQTFGGSGDLIVTATGDGLVFAFDDFFEMLEEDEFLKGDGRQSTSNSFESMPISETSYGSGTEQELTIDLPANGRFDITLSATDDITDVTIVAAWNYAEFIDPITKPNEPVEPIVEESCRDLAESEMKANDKDGNGVLSANELTYVMINDQTLDFARTDLNVDGEIEYAELLQVACSCTNELTSTFEQLSPNNKEVNIEKLSSQVYENQYNFLDIDSNSNRQISRAEIDILILLCETTFDAFDGDGDGVPDVDDAFPDDPDETKDTDGDGVGDNADLAPSVANDLIYSAGAILAIGLLAMLVLVARSSRRNVTTSDWDSDKQYNFAEQMLDMQESNFTPENLPQANDVTNSEDSYPSDGINANQPVNNDNLFEQLIAQPESPPQQLLGMIDANGLETIEYPVGSGITWQRFSPTQPWSRK